MADTKAQARALFERMLDRRTVWVDSEAKQPVEIRMIALEDNGSYIAFDQDGNDRLVEEYLLHEPRPPKPPCPGFAWIGQPITSCDNCGKPAWDHDYDQRVDRDASPFAHDGWKYVPWDADLIDGWRRNGYITPERAMHLLAVGAGSGEQFERDAHGGLPGGKS